MTDYLELAMTYGGFTRLDKVYLEQCLANFSDEQKRLFITPPPSVINAYFAELYQKQSPKAASDYYFELSKALDLFNANPSFVETLPFIRLNLSGKSFGYAYENAKEEAIVFSENQEKVTEKILLELAQIFPQYKIYRQADKVKMAPLTFDDRILEKKVLDQALLTDMFILNDGMIKIAGFNQEEVLEIAKSYKGKAFYSFEQRQYIIYITND